MTTSQRELLILLANIVQVNMTAPSSPAQKRITELLAEINAGSQDVR